VVGSGRTLRQHALAPFGDVICRSEAVLVAREPAEALTDAASQLAARLRGVVLAQQYLMLEYNCPRERLDQAMVITPGLESPTVSPLADHDWVAVRAMVLRHEVNPVMDALSALGAQAILAYDIRSCRM
jgi:ATP phosphoribosyltransferase